MFVCDGGDFLNEKNGVSNDSTEGGNVRRSQTRELPIMGWKFMLDWGKAWFWSRGMIRNRCISEIAMIWRIILYVAHWTKSRPRTTKRRWANAVDRIY